MEDLLLLCAVPRWLDADLLPEVGAPALARLLESGELHPLPAHSGRYAMPAQRRDERLSLLRAEQPALALELHALALERRLARAATPDEADEALYHLDELFALLKQRGEWNAILAHVERVRRLPAAARGGRLELYEGYALTNLHRYERGTALLSAVLRAPGSDIGAQIQALAGLAQAAWYQTDFDRAIGHYRQMHDLAVRHESQLYQALALINIGGAYNELHMFEQALEHGMRSLPIFRALGERTREAHALYQTGVNALYLGRWPLAQQHLAAAIALFEALGDERMLASLHWADGYLRHMLGEEAASESAYLRALAIARRPEAPQPYLHHEILRELGLLYQCLGRDAEALACYDAAVELAAGLQGQHRVSLIQYRRGTLLERLGRPADALASYAAAIDGIEALRGDAESELVKIGLMGTAQHAYESIALLLLAHGRDEEAFAYVERARSRAFLDLLARRDPQLTERFRQPVAGLAEVQAALPEDALLLEYFTTGVVPRGDHLLNHIPESNTRLRAQLAPPPQTWIFAVTRDGLAARRSSLDPNTLRPHPGDPGPGQRLLRGRLLASLHERLIAPVADLLEGRSLLYLAPHGPLHYVPFMALLDAAGRPLLDAAGPAVALAPSATVLLRCLARPRRAGGALAVGYNDAGADALRYAEAEAAHIARLTDGSAWTAREPKSARLAAEAHGLRLLHIAGHAIYNPSDPLASELRVGPGDALAARDIIGAARPEADLVTLSACTSGLSHVVPGDELLGLQRAFLAAGAATVVCALWEAADLVSLLVMDRFYRAVLAGAAPAAALRDAQVSVRELTGRGLMAALDRWRADDPALIASLGELPIVPPDQLDAQIYADPRYWAPFMLIGRPD